MKEQKRTHEVTLAQQCYQELESAIIEGALRPGQKLKMIDLKALLDAGQSPIREALSRLVTTGLVETEDNKGFRITEISESDIRDIYRTYLQIELLALNQALDLGGLEWESGIVAALYELSTVEPVDKPVKYAQWAEKNYNFHVALIAGCNSPTLLQIRADVYRRFDRYCRIAFALNNSTQQLTANHQEHKELADAVLQRDRNKVIRLMTYHIMGALEDVVQQLKDKNIV